MTSPDQPDDATRHQLETLASAISRSPGNWDLYRARAAIHFRLRDYPSAIRDLGEVTRLHPGYAEAYINIANAYSILGRYQDAIAELDRVLTFELRRDDRAQACYLRGRTYLQVGRLDEAERDLNDALASIPDHPLALSWRSKLWFSREQYERCIADCSALIERDAHVAGEVFWRRGTCYAEQGRLEEAIRDLDHAIRISPSLVRALISRAYVHKSAGRYKDAIRDFSAALRIQPDYVVALNCRAECQLAFGALDLAIDDSSAAIAIEPDNTTALVIRANAYATSGKHRHAADDLYRAIAATKDDPPFHAELSAKLAAVQRALQEGSAEV